MTDQTGSPRTGRYLYQCPGCWSYGLWAIPIGGGRAKGDEGWIECGCSERMTRIDLRTVKGADPMTVRGERREPVSNEAADELRARINGWPINNDQKNAEHALLDEALRTERRMVVEQIREPLHYVVSAEEGRIAMEPGLAPAFVEAITELRTFLDEIGSAR